MAGVLGFEPRNGGVKVRCLTAWRYPNILRLADYSEKNEKSKLSLLHLIWMWHWSTNKYWLNINLIIIYFMKSLWTRAVIFWSIVSGAMLLIPNMKTHTTLKKEVIAWVNWVLIKWKYWIWLNRSCHIRITPHTSGVLVCQEDVSNKMVDIVPIDAAVLPSIVSETIEIRDIRPTSGGILNDDTGEFITLERS